MQDFREAEVWQHAHQFVLNAYRLTRRFPKDEMFALGVQLRRAAVWVPANFAEGFRRQSKADKLRFYDIAQASADECAYYLILAHDLKYDDTTKLQHDLARVCRKLNAYRKAVRQRNV